MIPFTINDDRQFENSVIYQHEIGGEQRKFKDNRMNFYMTQTVLVNRDLYVFKFGSPVSACKYADFTTKYLAKTILSALPRNEHLQSFSVSFAGPSIVLTGGMDLEGIKSAQTYLMYAKTGEWKQKLFPDLN